jgi:hypothetical protein
MGGKRAANRISFLIQQGLRLMAEAEGGDPGDGLRSVNMDEGQ